THCTPPPPSTPSTFAPHALPHSFPTRRSSDLVTPSDGLTNGTLTSASATVQNTAPVATNTNATVSHASTGINITLPASDADLDRSEEHTSELQSQSKLVCRLLLENVQSGTFLG